MTRDVSDANRRTVLQGLAATGALGLAGNTTARTDPTPTGHDGGGSSSVLTPVYRLYDGANVDHFYTTSQSEKENAVRNLGYRDEGIEWWAFNQQVAGTTPLYRLYVPGSGGRQPEWIDLTVEAVEGPFGGRLAKIEISAVDRQITAEIELLANGQPTGSTTRISTGPGGTSTIQIGSLDSNARNEVRITAEDDRGNQAVIVEPVGGGGGSDDALPNHFYTTSPSERDNAADTLGYTKEGVEGYLFEEASPVLDPIYRLYRSDGNDHFYTTSKSERDNAASNGYRTEGIVGYGLTE
jgi:hypothetical protein